MRQLRFTLSALILVGTLYVGQWSVGSVPALGGLLHPTDGIWGVAIQAELPRESTARIPGLTGQVRVAYDDRGVPHIFASSVDDATRALGYVVARDRLFQLELQTRVTAGTLSELLGPRTLEFDREQRRYGLAWSAERQWGELDPNARTARSLGAFADGVNAWIDGEARQNPPFEYRLLGVQPMHWEPQHALYLIKRMGYTLTLFLGERRRDRIEAMIGADGLEELFGLHSPISEPIVPPPPTVGAPTAPELVRPATVAASGGNTVVGAGARDVPEGWPRWDEPATEHDDPIIGSNNWAVSAARTEAGFAILAGDPHLELTLPSIWYEIHMVVPGEIDVYGVTIPGIPGVVIGFNRRVAWSFTNTEADVVDLYAETLDDPDKPTSYTVDGVWQPLTRRIEEFRDTNGELLATDTIYFTHRGPLLRENGQAHSLRWTVLEDAGEIQAFAEAARASSVAEWLMAMESYVAPPQNMLVADWTGSIAIRPTGRFPVRPNDGRGDRIFDGSRSANEWLGYLATDRLPTAIDPPQGFLASANQEPVDPAVDTTYYGANWPSPWRALRINQLLRADSSVTPDDMQRFQLDPGSARADRFVPAFLQAAEHSLSQVQGDDELREAAQLLAQWDRRYTMENERAVLFEMAMEELVDRVWDELALPSESDSVVARNRIRTPSSAVLATLLNDSTSRWWDDRRTPGVREDRDGMLNASLKAALRRAKDEHGAPEDGGWRWDRIRHVNIYHLLRIPALSALNMPIQGGPGTLNPSSGSGRFGASWRMVVELRPEVRAWTIYPGGQSGNPVSSRYRDRIEHWVSGQLEPVLLPRQPGELEDQRTAGVLILVAEEDQP